MLKQRAVRHFQDVFRWSPDAQVETAGVLAAALGMASSVLVGILLRHEAAGFALALGGLAVSGVEISANARDYVRRETEALLPALLAATAAVAIAASGQLAALILVATAVIAAVVGGFSRAMAVASTRFIIFLMIVSAVPNLSLHGGLDLLVLIGLGAAWTSALGLGFAAFVRTRAPYTQKEPQSRQPTADQKLKHLLRSLKSFSGWNYTVRLGSCLFVAAILQWVWPYHHFHWIGLTIALLTSRRPEPNAVKTTQRTLGTGIGVILAGVALDWPLPAAALVVVIGVLAGARSHFRQRNYLAYSAVMTPLVFLIIDAGRPPELPLLGDRLLATVIGGLLVTFFDYAFRQSPHSKLSVEKPER